jgi:serine/threonine protein kinase
MSELSELAHYRIETLLGEGRYTHSYRAVDTVRRRIVALKVLKLDELPGQVSMSRFLEHVRYASDLIHPHLAWIWETGESDGFYYLVERYVNGISLARALSESGPLPWEQALQIIQQISQGLDFAHAKDCIHSDVAPHNILLSPDLGAVLTDFGLMFGLQSAAQFSMQNQPLGAAQYVPPEIWEQGASQPASDQYALACVLAEALSGQILFDAPTSLEIMSRHLAPPQLPPVWPVQVPPGLNKTLERALAPQPASRFPTSGGFARTLENLSFEPSQDPLQRARQEEETRAWIETQEKIRQQAEDVERQAALEQARLEIQEQVRRAQESLSIQGNAAISPPILQSTSPVSAPSTRLEGKQSRTNRRRRWPLWAGLGFLILAFTGLWWSGKLSPSLFLLPTATPTPTLTLTSTPTDTATLSPTPTLSRTPSLTPTATETASPTPSRTPTRTPKASLTPTESPTHTLTSTNTRVPKELNERRPAANTTP